MAKKTIFWPGWLIDNPLTEDPGDSIFSVKSDNMLTTEDIARQLVSEGTEFKLETLIDILNRGDRIIRNSLLAGRPVGTGVFYAYPSVSGVWRGTSDTFDEKRHKAGINFQPNAALRESLKSVGTEVLGMASVGPVISTVTDHWSGEVNTLLTPGEDAVVKGRNLRIEGDKEGVGIRFVRVDNDTTTPVEMRRLTVNNPSTLQFRIPALTAGDYWLEITTQYSNGNAQTKEPRTLRFDKVLNVPSAEPEG